MSREKGSPLRKNKLASIILMVIVLRSVCLHISTRTIQRLGLPFKFWDFRIHKEIKKPFLFKEFQMELVEKCISGEGFIY